MIEDRHVESRPRPRGFAVGPPTSTGARPSRILVADDHIGHRLGFRVALETAGYEVTEADDGMKALESLRNDPADLALLDLRMPGLDGMEILRRVWDEAIDVPVVIVTAHGDIPRAVRAMECGAIDFLSKPVEPALLRETILDVLVRRAGAGTGSYRPAPTWLGGAAHLFAEPLAVARRTLEHGHFELAESLIQQSLELDPDSPEANALRGALHERLGEHHAAYRCYRRTLTYDREHGPALDGMRRYCERFGLDHHNAVINPGARPRIPVRHQPACEDHSKDGKTWP